MPAIPKGVLSRSANTSDKTIIKKFKNKVSNYSFAVVLIVEFLTSTIFRDTIKGDCNPFWYVLFTQVVLFVIFLNMNVNRNLLKLCQRQIIITRTLMLYYLFAIISLVFNISDNFYISFVKWSLFSVIFICLLLTIYKKK